jgi:XTP/dITP diphosphohydrolase
MRLIFASNNQHKVDEMQAAIGQAFELVSLQQAHIQIDIPEPHDSLEANAAEKSGTIYRLTGMDCFSEDTGLEVEALGGEPGVRSARYAGQGASFEENIDKLLQKLGGLSAREARFRTVISLLLQGKGYLFEGVCEGSILLERTGSGGFGYDPIFVPRGSSLSFAQMTLAEKNHYSHRKKAADQLLSFLQKTIQASHGQDKN